jgi:hypothetical protein
VFPLSPNEQVFIRRAAAGWIKRVGLNRWVQCNGVWNLNGARGAPEGGASGRKRGRGEAWGARIDVGGSIAMRLTMADALKRVNAARVLKRARDPSALRAAR